MYGAIEAGGTKFVCAVSNERLEILEKISIPTQSSETTLNQVFQFFDRFSLNSIGIGSFGPIDVNEDSKTYGYITKTPKNGWRFYNLLGAVKEHYKIPVAWTTDVNAAAYGEFNKGSAYENESCLYLTVGTGIGGGAVINGELLEGYGHPEMGHLIIQKHPDDTYEGVCPYHENCLEGLAAGPAIERRYNKKGDELGKESKVWEIEAYYLAQAIVNYTLTLRPEKVILGGGVMKQTQLFPLIRKNFSQLLNDYVEVPNLDKYIVETGLGTASGITGCLLLAKEKSIK